jgi:hypothetical protein
MKVGWTTAFDLTEPVVQEMTSGTAPTAPYPWLHGLGYPLSDLQNSNTAGTYQQQSFEHGVLTWAPWYQANGAYQSCPGSVATCTGAAGQVGCPVLYGSRYTNYQVKRNAVPACLQAGIWDLQQQMFEPSTDFAFAIPAGATQDYLLGSYPAGTTVQVGNCDQPERSDGLQLTILGNGAPVAATGACSNGAPGRVYATFSSRLGTESWTARLSCPASAVGGCASTMHQLVDNDFNGDLIDVMGAYKAVPTASADASLIGLDDPAGEFTGADYGCSCHDDHPEGIVRLPGNRFAITTDFGTSYNDSGIVYLFKIATKPVDDRSRLGTNIVDDTLSDADRLITYDPWVGHTRGHLGGSTRSGHYVLTAAEADNDSVNGLISVLDTAGDQFTEVNNYGNSVTFGNNDGAAWVTSAKLGTGSSNPIAVNYLPPELRNAHLVVSAGTNMKTINFAYAKKDPTTGLSTLTPQAGQRWGDNFVAYATVPSFGGDNQASLITQADGEVYLMTLNGEVNGSGTGACEDSNMGVSHLYRLQFANCPSGAPVCFHVTGGDSFYQKRVFQTNPYVDMVRAAGTYLVSTGSAATEKIIVYGLWATKVSTLTGSGCGGGDDGGSWLRAMEF